ncbi:hypothetical protein ABIF38_003160 [Bradyrhizobium japonicum]|uniref:DUF1491 family protein n=1 Tax=Bradyrhizobium elkanii TaxID=29448 RepID=A0ABV4FD01_BRAEL|nr:hypothetical protein [Bradyrhizobium elkanii]MBP2432154.1 hypothetical protein [Bradyrhizobium elkanii]MCP1734524.1 hypothetical protein [Bradyrhizobium elkanii]MCP1752318.1 hypothetical protein [Bradyrhizobium elkanii]MCP1978091.1 hypothetical protein [Bradyrhizobium elkanii]MCS3569862.1 hypothetical protein [Bradyrhizobium elkanii]
MQRNRSAISVFGRSLIAALHILMPVKATPKRCGILVISNRRGVVMRCVVTLKDGGAMERAMSALAKYKYTAGGEPVAPEGHPREWKEWLLEIDAAEFAAINDHVDDGDVVDVRPISEPDRFAPAPSLAEVL